MAEPIAIFRQFASEQDAREYRHEHGTGGWIFASEASGVVVLFPPHMPPSCIMAHPLTRGFVTGRRLSGKLIGHA